MKHITLLTLLVLSQVTFSQCNDTKEAAKLICQKKYSKAIKILDKLTFEDEYLNLFTRLKIVDLYIENKKYSKAKNELTKIENFNVTYIESTKSNFNCDLFLIYDDFNQNGGTDVELCILNNREYLVLEKTEKSLKREIYKRYYLLYKTIKDYKKALLYLEKMYDSRYYFMRRNSHDYKVKLIIKSKRFADLYIKLNKPESALDVLLPTIFIDEEKTNDNYINLSFDLLKNNYDLSVLKKEVNKAINSLDTSNVSNNHFSQVFFIFDREIKIHFYNGNLSLKSLKERLKQNQLFTKILKF